jgi:hypothetical protein
MKNNINITQKIDFTWLKFFINILLTVKIKRV